MKFAGSSHVDLTRRSLLAASAGFIVPRIAWSLSREHEALCWKLEERTDTARESVTGADDEIASHTGLAIRVGEAQSRALRLDSYSVWFKHNASAERGCFERGTLNANRKAN